MLNHIRYNNYFSLFRHGFVHELGQVLLCNFRCVSAKPEPVFTKDPSIVQYLHTSLCSEKTPRIDCAHHKIQILIASGDREPSNQSRLRKRDLAVLSWQEIIEFLIKTNRELASHD